MGACNHTMAVLLIIDHTPPRKFATRVHYSGPSSIFDSYGKSPASDVSLPSELMSADPVHGLTSANHPTTSHSILLPVWECYHRLFTH